MNRESFFIFALLLKCSTYAHNKYWNIVFENMSNNITPHESIIIQDNSIYYYINKKKYSYNIADEDLKKNQFKIIYNNIYNFLKKKIGIESIEGIDTDIEQTYISQQSKNTTWSDITKKSDILFYIEKYLFELKQKHDLNYEQMVHFNKYIKLPFILKKIYNSIEFCSIQKKITNIKKIKIKDGKPIIID
jgi:hypothetical protein